MPRGRGRGSSAGHKGSRRYFTNPDQLAQNEEKKEKERQWRQQRGELESDEEESESEESESESEEEIVKEGEEDGDKEVKAKGVQHLIEVENPNRLVKKDKKITELETTDQPSVPNTSLSRREREELEKQKAKVHYQKMHAAGKTNEAKADLARLAIIRKEREEAAKKREAESKAKQDAEQAKAAMTKKALGKKA